MCQFENAEPTPNGENQWVLDNPRMRSFVGAIDAIRETTTDVEEIIAAIRPHFAELMADQEWLPQQYQEPSENSGMGGGIGMWLLYRAGDGSLAFSSLVVPPGAETPVHDHLSWGLVGLYRGAQDEIVYKRVDDGADDDRAVLEVLESNSLAPGDFYDLLPWNDIHRVKTTSETTSVSLHLLGNDQGCVLRHRFYPDEAKVVPFKSGYVNVPCREEAVS
jgi:predicted metal-dependent enzyme (double-stranded beta helix superfamily)